MRKRGDAARQPGQGDGKSPGPRLPVGAPREAARRANYSGLFARNKGNRAAAARLPARRQNVNSTPNVSPCTQRSVELNSGAGLPGTGVGTMFMPVTGLKLVGKC